jgi:hypothetical protein
MGCVQNVYEVEIDFNLLQRAEAGRSGFGAVKATRGALPMCHVEVESCYESRGDALGCLNPEFGELPLGEPTFRIFAQIRPTADA